MTDAVPTDAEVDAEIDASLADFITKYTDDLRAFAKSQGYGKKKAGGGNPCHEPSGSSEGGQFCETGDGGDKIEQELQAIAAKETPEEKAKREKIQAEHPDLSGPLKITGEFKRERKAFGFIDTKGKEYQVDHNWRSRFDHHDGPELAIGGSVVVDNSDPKARLSLSVWKEPNDKQVSAILSLVKKMGYGQLSIVSPYGTARIAGGNFGYLTADQVKEALDELKKSSKSPTFYHATTAAALAKIRTQGLKVKGVKRNFSAGFYQGERGESIYVSNDVDSAKMWAEEIGWGGRKFPANTKFVILKVQVPKGKMDNMAFDKEGGGGALQYHGRIPPEWITEVSTLDRKWSAFAKLKVAPSPHREFYVVFAVNDQAKSYEARAAGEGGNPCHDPDTGRFCEGGEDGGEHPGEGYSKNAKLRADGSIYTTNVHDAARALYEGKKVELDQPKKISTLIHALGKEAERWQKAGQKAPLFDLCNVSVAGTNLFCAESKGIPRVKMPQLNAEQTKKFIEYLKDKGYNVERGKEKAANLRATQNQLDGAKVAENMDKIDSGVGKDPRLVISKDDYILDGHHRWAAKLGVDSRDGDLTNDTKMKISRVNISITKLLDEAEKFTGGKGHVGVGERAFSEKEAARVWAWLARAGEGNPCHDPGTGQFCEGGGGSGGLDMDKAQKIGPRLGSNPGGVYEINGKQYYIKTGKSADHVRNELTAVDLARAAGVNTLNYVPVKGGNHVASEFEKLTKDNIDQFDAKEKAQARGNFVAHAWLANWDAAGLENDNMGTRNGRVIALDMGGALDYRAQGGPKGPNFGTKVGELETMRDSKRNPENARLFKPMTDTELRRSAEKVTRITDQRIRDIVAKHGGKLVLADKLIARRDYIKDWIEKFKTKAGEGNPCHDPDTGQFCETGEGGGGTTPTTPTPTALGPSVPKPAPPPSGAKLDGNILHVDGQKLNLNPATVKGTTAERVKWRKAAKSDSVKSYNIGYDAAKEIKQKIQQALIASFIKQHNALLKKGDPKSMSKAGELEYQLKKLGSPVAKEASILAPKPSKPFEPPPFSKEPGGPLPSGMKPLVPEPEGPPPGVTAEQAAAFADLVSLSSSSSAKNYVTIAKNKLAANPVPGMDAYDLASVVAYSGNGYGKTNQQLRSGAMDESTWHHTLRLNNALDQLPPYHGEVRRGTQLDFGELSKYKKGMIIEERAFTSASKGSGWSGNARYIIQSKSGRDITKFSTHPSENEVLFKSGTRFRVTGVETSGGVTIIRMTEVATPNYAKV